MDTTIHTTPPPTTVRTTKPGRTTQGRHVLQQVEKTQQSILLLFVRIQHRSSGQSLPQCQAAPRSTYQKGQRTSGTQRINGRTTQDIARRHRRGIRLEHCPVRWQSTVHHARHKTILTTPTTANRISTTERGISTTPTMATKSGMAEKKHVTCRGV